MRIYTVFLFYRLCVAIGNVIEFWYQVFPDAYKSGVLPWIQELCSKNKPTRRFPDYSWIVAMATHLLCMHPQTLGIKIQSHYRSQHKDGKTKKRCIFSSLFLPLYLCSADQILSKNCLWSNPFGYLHQSHFPSTVIILWL